MTSKGCRKNERKTKYKNFSQRGGEKAQGFGIKLKRWTTMSKLTGLVSSTSISTTVPDLSACSAQWEKGLCRLSNREHCINYSLSLRAFHSYFF